MAGTKQKNNKKGRQEDNIKKNHASKLNIV